MEPIAIVIWSVLIGIVLLIVILNFVQRMKYRGQDMTVNPNWYEESQAKYLDTGAKKAYFFHFDKNFLNQGHIMEDRNHEPVYEAKILYGNIFTGYEMNLENHIINYHSHHKLGAVSTTSVGVGNIGTDVSSSFKFDKVNIWKYLSDLGYSYHFNVYGIAYKIDVMKDGNIVGEIYSSNNGKNYFDNDGPIEAKVGGRGLLVVECEDKDVDAMFLYAMAFSKTELSLENLR